MRVQYSNDACQIPGKQLGEFSAPNKIMPAPKSQKVFCTKDDGYRGIWHGQIPFDCEYGYKYSGGLGTYSAKSIPFAIYRPEVNRTYFCWGGTAKHGNYSASIEDNWDFCRDQLYHMISYFDHTTGMVPRPTILLDKYCADAHDNPVISIDEQGYIWIFSPSHGEWTTRSFIHRSTEPHTIDSFELIMESLFAYPQIHYVKDRGFIFMHTSYSHGRGLRVATSLDGITWTKPLDLASIDQGHYQVTNTFKNVIGSAFDYHPKIGGLEYRTNLYYMQSDDFGKRWTTITGQELELPLTLVNNPALVHNYEDEGLKVYVKDIQFNSKGWPLILYLVSKGWELGPKNSPRFWKLAQWTGGKWHISDITTSTNNYDMGSLYLEDDGTYRIIAATQPGPQRWNTGGEVAVWISRDQGYSWSMDKQITGNSQRNHTFIRRPVNAHPDFYGFWADGDGAKPSTSCIYYCNSYGAVFRLPSSMHNDSHKPEQVFY